MEEYVRNRRCYVPPLDACSNLVDLGRTRYVPAGGAGGELLGRLTVADREGMRKVCGVLMAMPQGTKPGNPGAFA
jgi:hypothetical protein